MAKRIPEWLDWFSLTVTDENGNGLFNQDDFDVKELRLPENGGCAINDEITIKKKSYIVKNIIVYNDIYNRKNISNSSPYYIQLDIIVQEKVGL